jgi:EAL domain-containing protein (putative c-di-GMP-specific phosphodiesterase class I)
MAPDAFLPLVQDAGLGPALTDTVLDAALRECARWRRGDADVSVAVNLTTPELLDTRLPGRVEAALARHGLPGCALVLEITEGVFLVDRATSVAVLRELRRHGVRISIDDYGTGYSSLAYLRELPLDELKLDRSFTGDLDGDPRTAAIVESTVRLAHSLGLAMVAEGVETTAALDRLRSYGCDLAQGYGISRPLAADDVARALADLSGRRLPVAAP